ncbi:MAG TPA: hypothetical protein VGK47_11370 [Nitrososphaeraceae archaeon]
MSEVIYPPCKKCGASHKMGVINVLTDEITPIDVCSKCIVYGTVTPILEQVYFENNEEGLESKSTP